jgi:hypothetical protein
MRERVSVGAAGSSAWRPSLKRRPRFDPAQCRAETAHAAIIAAACRGDVETASGYGWGDLNNAVM